MLAHAHAIFWFYWLNDWITFLLSALSHLYNLIFTSIQSYYFNLTNVSITSTDTYSVHRQLRDERCTAIASAGPHSCRMTYLSRRTLTRRDCGHSHLLTKESTPAACSSWLLKEVGWWCTQQFSSIISSSANPTDAGTVPISLLQGVPWHYQCWHSGELHLEHGRGRWDGGGSAGRLPRNSWIVALQTVGWVVFQIRIESDIRTYIHAYISSQQDFSLYFYQKSVYVVCVCMYLMYLRNNVCEYAWVYVGCGCACEGNDLADDSTLETTQRYPVRV